jgi:hypothetical protein
MTFVLCIWLPSSAIYVLEFPSVHSWVVDMCCFCMLLGVEFLHSCKWGSESLNQSLAKSEERCKPRLLWTESCIFVFFFLRTLMLCLPYWLIRKRPLKIAKIVQIYKICNTHLWKCSPLYFKDKEWLNKFKYLQLIWYLYAKEVHL